MRTILPLAAAALIACGAEPRTVTADTPDVVEAVEATNAFTLDAYRASVAASTDDNVFVSPFSMAAALSMTYAGANSDTATEMAQVLNITDDEAHHSGLGALIRDLSGDHRRAYTLHVANKIWGQDDMTWQVPFLDINANDYGADVELVDIKGDPNAARLAVNDWAADQTHDRIKDLLPPPAVTPLTRMILANAIYFKGDWSTAFDKDSTRPEAFTHLDGSTSDVDRMHLTTTIRMGEGAGYRVASLPYKSEELSMWVVLPDEDDGLSAIEASMSVSGLDAAMASATEQEVYVGLPKLRIESEIDLKPLLIDMGMPSAFDEDRADFSGMTTSEPLHIGAAVHKAFVLIDEQGTEAAAATGITMGTRMSNEPKPQFLVDHPYLFVIRDELTGAYLFIGHVTDPGSLSPE